MSRCLICSQPVHRRHEDDFVKCYRCDLLIPLQLYVMGFVSRIKFIGDWLLNNK